MAGERAGLQSPSSASGHLSSAPAAPQQLRGAGPARGRQRAGPEGLCCSIQTSGGRAPGSGSSAMWSNFGGGWQRYRTRTETAVHHRGWKGSCWSSSSLCALIGAPSDAPAGAGATAVPHPARCLPAHGCPTIGTSGRWPPPGLSPALAEITYI